MCDDCFDEVDGAFPSRPAAAPADLLTAARRIERDMAGPPLSDQAWAIYAGSATGALAWPVMERMTRCVEAAGVLLDACAGGDGARQTTT